MSSVGYPDYQRITQWLGAPLLQGVGVGVFPGPHVDGPIEVANYASVIVALKAIGGNATVTVKQTVPAGPASLVLTETIIVPAGGTIFESFVLFGQAVELDITGSIAGTTVDYALYGSNTTTNAQVITSATINVQHNDVLVAAEPTLDLEDDPGFPWTVTDDAVGTRVKITPPPGVVRCRVASPTQVQVANTVVETDLFGGVAIIPAGAMGPNGWARLKFHGGLIQGTGAPQNLPRFRGYLGGVLAFDTGFGGVGVGINSSGSIEGWMGEYLILARGSVAGQLQTIKLEGVSGGAGADAVNLFAAGPGQYELRNGGSWQALAAEIGGSVNMNLAQAVALTVTNPIASPSYNWIKEYVSLETCYMP